MREIEDIEGKDHASLFKREGLVLQMIMALKQICNHPAQFLKTNQSDAELSGKSILLTDLVRTIVENGEKVFIFTQFRERGNLLVKILEKAGIQSMFLHGGTPLKKTHGNGRTIPECPLTTSIHPLSESCGNRSELNGSN